MTRAISRRIAHCITAFCAITALCDRIPSAEAQDQRGASVPSTDAPIAGRSDGVLAESYQYHRIGYPHGNSAHLTIAPEARWYGYGFPMQTYRWGWFGAERYYPRVVWHRGYYGDCCRWAYRHGY